MESAIKPDASGDKPKKRVRFSDDESAHDKSALVAPSNRLELTMEMAKELEKRLGDSPALLAFVQAVCGLAVRTFTHDTPPSAARYFGEVSVQESLADTFVRYRQAYDEEEESDDSSSDDDNAPL